MAIDKAEWERRLKAARELRGITEAELIQRLKRAKLEGSGVAATGPVKAARPGDPQVPTNAMVPLVAGVLDLPEEWFTAEDFTAWIRTGAAPPDWQDHLVDEFRNRHAELIARLSRLHTEQERQMSLLKRGLDELGGRGNG